MGLEKTHISEEPVDKQYATPTIVTLGSIEQLTSTIKCGGSGDVTFPGAFCRD